MSEPHVSVLMPVYNGETYLRTAIESILSQTFRDYEFIIVNDGSTDGSSAILAEYAMRDPRIVLIHHHENAGLVRSLNNGLGSARGDYIARMDCDDISLPERLARQVAFMDAHPEIGVCGTWTQYFGMKNWVWHAPQHDAEIKSQLFFDAPIAHPSAMLRRATMTVNNLAYRPEFLHGEDYGLWAEAATVTSFANLPEVLLHYRIHNAQSVAVRRAEMVSYADMVRLRLLARLGIIPPAETAKLHLQMVKLDQPSTKEFITWADAWLQKLQAANRQTNAFPEPAFSKRLSRQWFVICRNAANWGMFSWRSFHQSPLSRDAEVAPIAMLRFRAVCTMPWLRRWRRRSA